MDLRMQVVSASQSRRRAASRPLGEYLLFHCVIVSPDETRQQLFEDAASEQGWEVVRCRDAESALGYLRRRFAQLAIIDLSADESGELAELLDCLPSSSELLTIVCGREDDMEEEIWVRQTGVWLYLPGADDATNLAMLCGEAKRIIERKLETVRGAASPPGAMRRAN